MKSKIRGFLAASLLAGFVAFVFAHGAEKPLNLILIMADDLGYETITCNGGESYLTPNLDKMAEGGMRFEHCYSQSICTPSRVQIMTGKYFGGMVHHMDKLVGRIVEQVEKAGIADQTVIIFTGDNGTDKPVVSILKGQRYAGAKGSSTNAGNHVPLIVHAPGLKGRGVKQDLVDFSDMLPTLCDLAGIDHTVAGGPFDGRSIAPRLRGEECKPRDYVFSWYSPSGNVGKGLKVWAHTGRYKLYRDGGFFDIQMDGREKKVIKPESMTDDQKEVKAMLKAVLDKHLKEVGR